MDTFSKNFSLEDKAALVTGFASRLWDWSSHRRGLC